jgi:hypothetical protein
MRVTLHLSIERVLGALTETEVGIEFRIVLAACFVAVIVLIALVSG